MKNIQNTCIFVVVLLIISMTTFGCNGTGRGSLRKTLFANRNTPVSGQSASDDSALANVEFDAAKKEAARVALASYDSPNGKAKHAQWLRSYDKAVELSKQSGKPILADFTGSNWCGYCIKLKKEVFDTPQFAAWAAENVVLLELDYPKPNLQADWIKQQNTMLQSRYRIDQYPTVLILNHDGSVIGSQGYKEGGPDRWIAIVNNTVQSHHALQNAEFVDASDLVNLK